MANNFHSDSDLLWCVTFDDPDTDRGRWVCGATTQKVPKGKVWLLVTDLTIRLPVYQTVIPLLRNPPSEADIATFHRVCESAIKRIIALQGPAV